MPMFFIEALRGIRADAKMVEAITTAIDDGYYIGTLIFLPQHSVENVAVDGKLQSENPKILAALKKISSWSMR